MTRIIHFLSATLLIPIILALAASPNALAQLRPPAVRSTHAIDTSTRVDTKLRHLW